MSIALAHPNIALTKYWGKRDAARNLPATPSLSLTLGPYLARTEVVWGAAADSFELNGAVAAPDEARKVFRTLDALAPGRPACAVVSSNNFPTAAGLASSAAGFAALVVAASAAGGLGLGPDALAEAARLGSGSATRSVHGGWVEWPLGDAEGRGSRGAPLAPAEHWDVRMVVAVLGAGPKAVGSTEGMNRTAATSPYFPAWVAQAPAEQATARAAILRRDLEALGACMERSAWRMHASMMAADPPFTYLAPGSLQAIEVVRALRRQGVGAWFTMDAGPNVKVLVEGREAERVAGALREVVPRVEVLHPGGPARVVA